MCMPKNSGVMARAVDGVREMLTDESVDLTGMAIFAGVSVVVLTLQVVWYLTVL